VNIHTWPHGTHTHGRNGQRSIIRRQRKKEEEVFVCRHQRRWSLFQLCLCGAAAVAVRVCHKRSDGGGRCDNATSIIIQHQLERRVGGIDLSHHHLLVSGCRLVDGQTPPMPVPCPPTVRHLPPTTAAHFLLPVPAPPHSLIFSPHHPLLSLPLFF
jgi:hypothetical protein